MEAQSNFNNICMPLLTHGPGCHQLPPLLYLLLLQASYALGLGTAFHELGHNLGLQHSTTPGNEYGDNSCVMAGCCNTR